MSGEIVFIDTSIMCNIVPVPGFDQHRQEVLEEYAIRREERQQFVLPITTVIETGNHIAHVSNGGLRRTAAETFAGLLSLVANGEAPWVLNDVPWNAGFLGSMLSGADCGQTLVELAVQKVGVGDLCIMTERLDFATRVRLPAEIWTLDEALNTHSGAVS